VTYLYFLIILIWFKKEWKAVLLRQSHFLSI
jgi:hypothetical protein